MSVPPKLVGKKFYRLTVKELTNDSRGGSRVWRCLCDCGNECFVSTRHLNRKNNIVKSCGCLKKEVDSKKGKDSPFFKGYEGISQLFWNSHVLRSAKGTGGKYSRKPLDVTIDKQYLWELYQKQEGKCGLSGLPISLPETYRDGMFTASVDRIDSSKGYIPGNVQWVHKHVNLMKNSFNQEYFIEMCKHIAYKTVK